MVYPWAVPAGHLDDVIVVDANVPVILDVEVNILLLYHDGAGVFCICRA